MPMPHKERKPTVRGRWDQVLDAHPALPCLLVAAGTFVGLFGLAAFLTLSGFGASTDFIYNQF